MDWPPTAMLSLSFMGLALVVLANILYYRIIQEVNAAAPGDERISPWRAGLRSSGLLERHRELYPASSKRSVMTWLSGLGVLFFLGAIVVGFLVKPVTHFQLMR